VSFLQSELRFLALYAQIVPNFRLRAGHFAGLVHAIRTVGVSPSIFLNLMGICAATTSIVANAMFLLRQPAIIPVVFAVYGETAELPKLICYFTELCVFSMANCIACHRSGIDSILLDFIYNLTVCDSTIVTFRGTSFSLNLSVGGIDSLILPFLSPIISVDSSALISERFVKLVLATHRPEIALSMAKYVNAQVSSMQSQLRPVFPVGMSQAACVIEHVSASLVNRAFTILFWFKPDKLVAFETQQTVPLFTFTSVSTSFSLICSRDAMVFSFTSLDKQATSTCMQNMKSNSWQFMAFVHQRVSQEMSAVGLFAADQLGFCQEVQHVPFPPEEEISIAVGGSGPDTLIGLLGPFFISSLRLDEEELLSV
jgi:hypothetical protein